MRNKCPSAAAFGCSWVWKGLYGRKPRISEWVWQAGRWPPQRHPDPGTCECVAPRDKRDFAAVIKLRIWGMGRLSGIIWVGPVSS